MDIVRAIKITSASAVVAGVNDPGHRRVDPVPRQVCSASAAQIARMRWKNGSQRKLHRNSPAAGSIATTSTSTSEASSHLIRLTSVRSRQMNPAMSATGATKPHANSVAVCGIRREEKLVHFTVQQGRIK